MCGNTRAGAVRRWAPRVISPLPAGARKLLGANLPGHLEYEKSIEPFHLRLNSDRETANAALLLGRSRLQLGSGNI